MEVTEQQVLHTASVSSNGCGTVNPKMKGSMPPEFCYILWQADSSEKRVSAFAAALRARALL